MTTSNAVRVLCVDDESKVLEGLSRILRKRYEVLTATGGELALELLGAQPQVAVIISDMRMPGLNGAQFLAKSRELVPDAQRILLTGQADIASAIAAVNEGQIFRFLTKPCPPEALLAAVQAAVDVHQAGTLERTVQRRKIEFQQLRIDPLTGLASRLQVLEMLEKAAVNYHPARAVVAWHIDIARSEGAKYVAEDVWNDEVPKVVADRLREHSSEAALVARWGTRQFAVLLPDISAGDLDLHLWGIELWKALSKPIQLGSGELCVDVSVGIARLVKAEQWPALMQCAAMASQEARRSRDGSARVCLRRPEVPLQAERERVLLDSLRETLDQKGLSLAYQPIIDVGAGRVRTLECLARWEHTSLGCVAPSIFIPLAERSGEIVRLGRWVLDSACHDCAPIIAERQLRVAVNVSAKEVLASGFLLHVEQCLTRSGLSPGMLELELTESALATDMEQLREILQELRRRRVRIAVDDFGTGYSSLAYLSRLPVDAIKVDRVFVHDFDRGGKTIIKAAVAMGLEFGREVIVEGVETSEMSKRLWEVGVTLMQGFWLAKPMPLRDFTTWMRHFRPEDVDPRALGQQAAVE